MSDAAPDISAASQSVEEPPTASSPYSAWQRGGPASTQTPESPLSPPLPPPMQPLPPPPVYAPEPSTVLAATSSLPPLQIAAIGGFAAAIVATLIPWMRLSNANRSTGVNGWSGDAQYQLSDWFTLDAPADALVVLVLAGFGIYLLLGRILGSNVPAIPWGVAVAGALIVLIGVVNWLYIDSESNRILNRDLSVGFGIYLMILGGAVAAFCGYRDVQEDRRAQTLATGSR